MTSKRDLYLINKKQMDKATKLKVYPAQKQIYR